MATKQLAHTAKQRAYSLIEVLVMVVIVGIMAALAVPAYMQYSIRTRVTEGIKLASTMQDQVAYFYTVSGQFPTQNTDINISLAGDEFATDAIKTVGIGTNGVITIAFKDLGGLTANGQTLKFIPTEGDGSISWDCDAAAAGATLPDQYTPTACRGVD